METIKWSKQQLDAEFTNCEHLNEVIVNIEKHLGQSQQVVCQIKVNDLLFTDRDEQKFAKTKLTEIESLEISFRTSDNLLRDSVLSLIAWMTELKSSVLDTAENFRTCEVSTSNYAFSRVIINIEWLTDALGAVRGHITATPEWMACETRLMNSLKELEGAFRNQDNILVADVLEYEVSMALDQWQEILSKVAAS